MIDYATALQEMHKGNVVQYIGTVNGDVWTDRGWSFCMQRGVVFVYKDGRVIPKSSGNMVYDPDFRYKLTGEKVDPRAWKPEKKRKDRSIRSMLGYSRIGLGNV